ncbi:MAG: hypothetical protein HY319_14605 [Armatimonadetes bacterium]|nr:hypothetical protein [Armatimonadota bacterium]
MKHLGSLLCATIMGGICAFDYLSGESTLQDLRDQVHLLSRSLVEWDRLAAAHPERSDLTVCLTSTPSRLPRIGPTLKSLLWQSPPPRRIRLHMPEYCLREDRTYRIPPVFEGLGLLELVQCPDHGPATKLLPALRDLGPTEPLVIVDDDKLFPIGFLADLSRWSRVYPDAALGFGGKVVPRDLSDRRTTLWSNLRMAAPTPVLSVRIRQPRPVDVLMGTSGYLVRPGYFGPEIFDYSGAPKAARYVDDVWISAHCRVPKYVVPSRRYCFKWWPDRRFFRATSLGFLNNTGKAPEERHNSIVFRHFADRWMHSRAR